ncbi:MAG TPA: hypothetical protein VG733_03535, partial [Chthoniobacteraceae bacterium]|nr:hypothetical protein [Chthoniobacteraceae bacterium]
MPLLPAWMKTKKFRITLFVIAIMASPFLFVLEENWRGKHEYEFYKRKLEAQGEHLDFDWFLGPPLSDDKNFATAPVFKPLLDYTVDPVTRTIDYNQPGAPVLTASIQVVPASVILSSTVEIPGGPGWDSGHSRDLKAWQDFYRAVLPKLGLSKSPPEDVLTALSQYDGFISDLRAAADTRPVARFPIGLDPIGVDGGYYRAFRSSELLLALRACAELKLGRTDAAFADVKLGFQIIGEMRTMPTLLGGLVRITNANVILQPVWEGLAAHEWTDEQLTGLETLLAGMDFLQDYETTLRGERAYCALAWDATRNDPKVAQAVATGMGASTLAGGIAHTALKIMRVCTAITWQNEVYLFRYTQENLVPLVDLKSRTVNVPRAKGLRDLQGGHNPYTAIARITLPVYYGITQKYAETQTRRDEARVACEIARSRHAQ